MIEQLESTGWEKRAACKGMPTNAFFSTNGVVPEWLLAVCQGCEVRLECLAAARREEAGHGRNYGVRGGMSAHQRYQLWQGLKG